MSGTNLLPRKKVRYGRLREERAQASLSDDGRAGRGAVIWDLRRRFFGSAGGDAAADGDRASVTAGGGQRIAASRARANVTMCNFAPARESAARGATSHDSRSSAGGGRMYVAHWSVLQSCSSSTK